MRNVTSYSVTLLLAAALAVPGADAQAQTLVGASLVAGPVFGGVGLGLGRHHLRRDNAFFGLSLGLAWAHSYGSSPYGIYSDTYDGWQRGYRVHHRYAYAAPDCWDPYWDPYWDSWGACAAFTPAWSPAWIYPDYSPWGFGFSFGLSSWSGPSVSVYMADPFAPPWGLYWSYDPWAGYWNAWGRSFGRGGYYGTRAVFAGRPGGWGGYRTAWPRRGGGADRGGAERGGGRGGNTGRTAHRRGTAGVSVPAPTRDPRGRVVQGNPLGVPGWGDPGTVRRTAHPRTGTRDSGMPGRGIQLRRTGVRTAPQARGAQLRRTGVRTAPRARSARPSGSVRSPVTARRSRPTDRLPASELAGRRSFERGFAPGAARRRSTSPSRRTGWGTPSSRFSTRSSRVQAPRTRSSNQGSVTRRVVRPETTRVSPRRTWVRQASPSRVSRGTISRRSVSRGSHVRAFRRAPSSRGRAHASRSAHRRHGGGD